ncbi:MAG: hypothetical protein HC773_05585 [Scytonema sp. CRU_2_7]|nr:hypothetical protein [Scytonema sp. CRU_2_7]
MATTFQGLTFADAAIVGAGVDGIFIPLAALPGLLSTELADAQANHLKYSKAIASICEKLIASITTLGFEGAISFSATKPNPAGAGLNLFNQSYNFSYIKVLDLQGQEIVEIPVPTTGTNLGIGDVDITDIFASAAKISAGDDISGAGVIVATSLLTPYSSISHPGLTINGSTDNREAISALIAWLGNGTLVRSTTDASGITARTLQTPPTIAAIPAAFTALPNPTSGILAAETIVRSTITRTVSITVNFLLNSTSQSFDVNSVTA